MVRLTLSSSLLLLFAACGDNEESPPPVDAAVDATPIDAAPVCSAPNKMCGAACLAVTEDENNCGDCGVVCHGGFACEGTCKCPEAFVGLDLPADQFDQLMGVGGGLTIAINPNLGSGGINPFIVGFDTKTALDADIDLATITLGEAPFVAAGYHFDIGTMEIDATFIATAGTLHLTDACATHAQGTITGVTFKGITGGFTDPMIDPEGCTFEVTTAAFEVGSGACP